MKQILCLLLVPLAAIGLLVFPLAAIVLIFMKPSNCALDSEENIVRVARAHIEKEIDSLVRHFEEPATEILAGRFILLLGYAHTYSYEVTYEMPRGQLVTIELNPACGANLHYSTGLSPILREDTVYVRDLRTGEPFIRK